MFPDRLASVYGSQRPTAIPVKSRVRTSSPNQPAAAAQIALRAGSSEDTPLLDLVAACQAQGQHAQAESYVKMIMANHDAEDEELRRRRWLPPAA